MTRSLFGMIGLTLLSWSGFAQSSNPFKFYKTQEEYCRANPQMPTCIKGKPLNLEKGLAAGLYNPAKKTPAPVGSTRGQISSPAQVALQDWRFSHQSPAILVSINIGSLLKSPIWTTLFSAWSAGGVERTADIAKARSALSEVGQLLISVASNGTANPAVLMLAKGNVDGAFGALLRSGAGMQAKHLDAITMLVGDAHSMEMASLRMRSTGTRAVWNALQTAATREALKYDAWIGVNPSHLAPVISAVGGGSHPELAMLTNLRSISVGLYLRDQIRLEAALEAPSPEMADRMLAAYQQMEAKRQSAKNPFGGQVWATADGAKLRFVLIVEGSRLKDLAALDPATTQKIGPQIAPLIQALAGLGSAQRSASMASPKPAQGAIVIQGLDSAK